MNANATLNPRPGGDAVFAPLARAGANGLAGTLARVAVRLLPYLAATHVAWAGPPSYLWADEHAQLHRSERLADVPEPFRSAYGADHNTGPMASGAEAAGAAGPARVSALAPRATELATRRAAWARQVRLARAELLNATDALARVDNEVGSVASNPILRLTPQAQDEVTRYEHEHAQARARVTTARQVLLNGLPALARQEGVPAAWLD